MLCKYFLPVCVLDFHSLKYRDVFLKGYPAHERLDSFRMKHPSMDYGQRAKIFSPFDALRGFSEAVAAKEVLYEFKRELDDSEEEELNRRLTILHNLTCNSRLSRQNKVIASVFCYIPCMDKDNFAYGYRGQYVVMTGLVRNVDTELTHTVTIDNRKISFSDIIAIESHHTVEGRNIFDIPWEESVL